MKTITRNEVNTSSDRAWTRPIDRNFEFQSTGSTFIDAVFSSRTLIDADGQTRDLDTYIPASQGDLLYSLVHYLKPERTLEVGLANGISALHIATALNELGHGKHLAIDPFQQTDWRNVGMVTLQRAGLDHLVTLDQRPSHWAIPDLDEAEQRIQFAFIDGSHLLDYVMTDFMTIDRILDVGGLIAFDDSDWPSILNVIRFAIANRGYTVFPTDIVIEPNPGRPRFVSRVLRKLVLRSKSLQRLVRNDFTFPDRDLGIEGRCVVLRKTADDQRHALRRQLVSF